MIVANYSVALALSSLSWCSSFVVIAVDVVSIVIAVDVVIVVIAVDVVIVVIAVVTK